MPPDLEMARFSAVYELPKSNEELFQGQAQITAWALNYQQSSKI
jgi:hypothetical protein